MIVRIIETKIGQNLELQSPIISSVYELPQNNIMISNFKIRKYRYGVCLKWKILRRCIGVMNLNTILLYLTSLLIWFIAKDPLHETVSDYHGVLSQTAPLRCKLVVSRLS